MDPVDTPGLEFPPNALGSRTVCLKEKIDHMKFVNNWTFGISSGGGVFFSSLGIITGGTPTPVIGASGQGAPLTTFGVWDLGGGMVAFSAAVSWATCTNGGPFWSSRMFNYGANPHGVITLAEFGTSNNWECTVDSEETFQLIPMGDGTVVIYSHSAGRPDSGSSWPQPGVCEGYLNLVTDNQHNAYPRYQWLAGGFGYEPSVGCQFIPLAPANGPVWVDLVNINRSAKGVLVGNLAGLDLSSWPLGDLDLTNMAERTAVGMEDGKDISLQGTNFTSAYLQGANMSGRSDLGGATFTHAYMADAQLVGCDLRTVDLRNVTLTGAKLDGANLTANNKLQGVNLNGADLTGAILDGTDFNGADLTGATLIGASMNGCKFAGALLTGTDLSSSDLTRAELNGFVHSTDAAHLTNFSNSQVGFATLGLDWSYINFTGATISGVPTDLTNLNATAAELPTGFVFDGHTLDGALFIGATASKASFAGAHMTKAKFSGAQMIGAVFTKATMDTCKFIGTALGGTGGSDGAVFSSAYMANCDFSQCNLFGLSFANATLLGNNVFTGANLQEIDLTGAYMADINLAGANLRGARLDRSFLVGAILSGADLTPTRDGSIRSSLTFACLQATAFDGVKLAGADLTNAALTGTAGSISQQYYDDEGELTELTPMNYAAVPLPDSSSLDPETVCANGLKYANQPSGATMAEMMTSPRAPTIWKPTGVQKIP